MGVPRMVVGAFSFKASEKIQSTPVERFHLIPSCAR
jgi:hypothetical protein